MNKVKMTLEEEKNPPRLIRTHYNRPSKMQGENCTGIHMTVPEKTMSIQELMEQFAGGLKHELGLKLFYDGEGHDLEITDDVLEGVKWETLDLVEKHNILATINSDMKAIKAKQDRDKSRINEARDKQKQFQAEHWAKFETFIKSQDNPMK